jgi:hypothetical protein
MDEWGWEQLRPWLRARAELPVRRLAARAGARRRFAPHQLRHAHALELARRFRSALRKRVPVRR